MNARIITLGDTAAENALGERFAKALEFLHRPDLSTLPLGRYEIDGDRVFAILSENTLKVAGTEQNPEFHKRYADVQAPLSAPETFGLPELPEAVANEPFDDVKDIAFFPCACPLTKVVPGECLVIPPMVAHAPCLTEAPCAPVKKAIVKVLW